MTLVGGGKDCFFGKPAVLKKVSIRVLTINFFQDAIRQAASGQANAAAIRQ